jgi:hypothetical protein
LLLGLFAFRETLTRTLDALRALGTRSARARRALGGLGALVDERAERVLEFVKRTRPTASHILTFKGSLEHSAYAEYAKASLGFWV